MLTATTDTLVLPQVDDIDPAIEAEVMQSIKEEDKMVGLKHIIRLIRCGRK